MSMAWRQSISRDRCVPIGCKIEGGHRKLGCEILLALISRDASERRTFPRASILRGSGCRFGGLGGVSGSFGFNASLGDFFSQSFLLLR